MALLKRNKQQYDLSVLAEELRTTTDTNRYKTLFIELIAVLRPSRKQSPEHRINDLLDLLHSDSQFQKGFQDMFAWLFNTLDSQSLFTDVGILSSGTFFSEFFGQLRHRILPPIPEKRSLNYLLERAFHKKNDYKWVAEIPDDLWIEFFKIAGGGLDDISSPFHQYLTNALTILSYRVAYLGLEDELQSVHSSDPEVNTPFILQNKRVVEFIHLASADSTAEAFLHESGLEVIDELFKCEETLKGIRNNTATNGTGLEQSYLLLRTSQQIMRMRIIIRMLSPNLMPQHALANSVKLFEAIIEQINKRYSIVDLYKKNSTMLAYQIAEHKSASGEHYITTTRPQYVAFFYSAAAGGVIIAIAAFIKALLHKTDFAPFWQYFNYSVNYAIAFVALFITGASLATKQPTMTASALASSLDSRKGGVNYKGMAITFGKVWRSQFASFAGNIIVVFPLAYLLSFIWPLLTGDTLLHDSKESLQALRDQNPLTSLAWLYASFTGVCLFISGIITGYVDNKVIYGKIGPRIKEHAGLRKIFKGKKLRKIADYITRNLGGILGNISLGFMLGYAQLVGNFFGVPFDIRHITISTAYFGFGLEGLNNHISSFDWIWTAIGVIGIGFFNFLISFSLAFYVAVRSRNVPLSRLPLVGKLILRYFRKFPQDFIYPPKKERKEADIFEDLKK